MMHLNFVKVMYKIMMVSFSRGWCSYNLTYNFTKYNLPMQFYLV